MTIMRAKSISAILNDTVSPNVIFESFTDCTAFYVDNLSKETGAIFYLLVAVSMVYLLNDITYSVVVLRLFVSNVLKLAVFTSEIKPTKHRKGSKVYNILIQMLMQNASTRSNMLLHLIYAKK